MLTIKQVAERAEISVETVRHYLKQRVKANASGTAPTARDLPIPNRWPDGTNRWEEAEIDAWVEARKERVKRGGIPKAQMQLVLDAALAGQIDRVIVIAKRNI